MIQFIKRPLILDIRLRNYWIICHFVVNEILYLQKSREENLIYSGKCAHDRHEDVGRVEWIGVGRKEAGEGGGEGGIKRFLVVRRWDADPQPPRVNYILGKPYRIILAPRRGSVQTVGTSPYRCSRARGYESLKSLRQGRGWKGRKSSPVGISPSDYTGSELFSCQSYDHSW